MDQSNVETFDSFDETIVKVKRFVSQFEDELQSITAGVSDAEDLARRIQRSINTIGEYVEGDELTGEELEKTMINLSIVAEEQQDVLSAGQQVLASFEGLKSALSHLNDLQESVDSQIIVRG